MTIIWHSAQPVLEGLETRTSGTHATKGELATPFKKISRLAATRQPLIAWDVQYVTWDTLYSHQVALVRHVVKYTSNAKSAAVKSHNLH